MNFFFKKFPDIWVLRSASQTQTWQITNKHRIEWLYILLNVQISVAPEWKNRYNDNKILSSFCVNKGRLFSSSQKSKMEILYIIVSHGVLHKANYEILSW